MMNKDNFIKEYRLSDAMPIDPALVLISASGYAAAIKDFINTGFRGIARVDTEIDTQKYVFVCAEYAALFFKQLLSDIYGRVFLNINVVSKENTMEILISCEGEFPITESEMRTLIKIARNAGMNFFLDGNAYRLTLAFIDTAVRRIYAVSLHDGTRIMLSKFAEIFHCGAVFNIASSDSTPSLPGCEPRYMKSTPPELFPSPPTTQRIPSGAKKKSSPKKT